MLTEHPGVTGRAADTAVVEPLAVSPRECCRLLGIKTTRFYQLLAAGELETYLDGRARRVTMRSIRARIARLLAADGATGAITQAPTPRRRGRPRKVTAPEVAP